jgi:Sulfotransferase family
MKTASAFRSVDRRPTPRHIVIIGAARSGTKMLRDALAEVTGVGKVPYDIGYVWRYGNERHPDDAIEPDAISRRSARFIRRFIDRYATGTTPAVIEKTVGNCMRVPAVAAVLPNATFIHLIRDGVDVIESARRQWTAPSDLRYLAGKLRHFPVRLAPRYGVKYLRSTASRVTNADRRVGSWGPRYQGIDDDLREHDLLTVCARQWAYAVAAARAELARPGLSSTEVRYEDLVTNPEAELAQLAELVNLQPHPEQLELTSRHITQSRQGVGRERLTPAELAAVAVEAGHLLRDLGYPAPVRERTDLTTRSLNQ